MTSTIIQSDVGSNRPERAESSHPEFGVAGDVAQVVDAWKLVYSSYRRIGLIDENPYEIHCGKHAVNSESVVVGGTIRGQTVSTLTMMHDGPEGLPLDKVYHSELEALRAQGRRFMEVGLLADRREQISRALGSIFEMMRYVYWESTYTGAEIIAGVHPHHSGFYINSFAFEEIGAETVHPTVKDHAVVLLHIDLQATMQREVIPKRLKQYLENPLEREVFEKRFDFSPAEVGPSAIGQFLGMNPRRAGAA